MKKIEIFFLLLIIFLAGILRFWNLSSNPPSLYWDEVSQGYNAYSILKTGYDEHHKFMPLTDFAAFGDYKAPVLIYLDVVSIAIFGLTSFAVRFPSAFLGVLTVLITYFLAFEFFFKNKNRNLIALFSSFFLAISPWHIQLSRVAYEGNIATFFFILGVYLFLLSLRKNFWFFLLATIFFVISFYAFNAFRVFTPLTVVALILIYFKEIFFKINNIGEKSFFKKINKEQLSIFILSLILGILILMPFIIYLKNPDSRLRFNEVNIFSDVAPIDQSNFWLKHDKYSRLASILDNRRIVFTFYYLKHYFDFLNPNFLFYSGDPNPRFSLQDNGELFWFELPILILGFYFLVKEKNKSALSIFVWFILAPVVGATAHETPHALRAETYLPTFQLIEALGASILFTLFLRIKWGKYLILLYIFWIVICLYLFWHDYFDHFKIKYAGVFQYGYKQAFRKAISIDQNYNLVLFSNIYGRAYIYYLFYSIYDPHKYWRIEKIYKDQFGFYHVAQIGKYIFGDINKNYANKKILYIGVPKEMPKNVKIIDKIFFLNGQTAFEIGKN